MSSRDLRTRVLRVFQAVPPSLSKRRMSALRRRGSSAPGPCARAERIGGRLRRSASSMNSPRRPSDSIKRRPSNWPMPWSTCTTKSPGFNSAKSAKKPEVRILRLGRSTAGVTSNRSALPNRVSFTSGNATPAAKGARINEQPRRFRSALGGETGGGFFGFAEDVRHFVFAADIGVALEFARAGRGQENGATGGDLRLHVAETGNDVAVEARAWPGTQFKTLAVGSCRDSVVPVRCERILFSAFSHCSSFQKKSDTTGALAWPWRS